VSTITYDLPIEDLIAGLDLTGHVTHTAYKKTSVTFHHNGGRLSHEGVLEVWKTREASAHFDVDGVGAVAQYVLVNEYAWATGNTAGNQSSISVEMANATLDPDWQVAEVTWRSAARLAGWLFARVIGAPPTADNVFAHHHWKQTTCFGPSMDKVYDQLLAEVQKNYEAFVGAVPQPAPAQPSAPAKKTVDQIAQEVLAGDWGNGPARAQRLALAGYSPTQVQDVVNQLTGIKNGPVKLSVTAVAQQVIAGQWGSGTTRVTRLSQSGYDAAAVQAEVNRLLK
jgi:Cpl-7 lysozyme-like protein/N-acetylmuramoyl-L-alanine amidase-like protein